MEIAPGIHHITTDLQHATGVTNTYLIVGTQGAVFVDAGWDRPAKPRRASPTGEKLGKPPLKGIAVTHRHTPHWGNAPKLQQACGQPPIIASVGGNAGKSKRACRAPKWIVRCAMAKR